MFPRMFVPLIIGFVVIVLFMILMGWVMDPDRHGDAQKPQH